MNGLRPVLSLLAAAAFLAAPALAACAEGGSGVPAEPGPYVAEFRLGGDSPEEREFVLTHVPGPRVQRSPEPSPVPPVAPTPDAGEEAPFEQSYTPAPGPGEQPALAVEPSVAWVDDGLYLAVITYGSGSCPSGPVGIEVVADQEIEIHLGPLFPGRDVCSADMSGHVTVVELPQGITPTKPLMARFGDLEVTISAVDR